MNRRSFLAAAATLALPGAASADALDDRLREVGAARARVRTLSGPFAQERTIGLLASKVSSRGKLALVRPDRLLWELDAPDSVAYWIGPEGLAYKGKQGQGRLPVSAKIAPALDDLRALLAGDLAALRARYEMSDRTAGKAVAFRAVPKNLEGARFRELSLELVEDLVRPRRVVLVEGPRDRTEIVFGDLAVDAAIDPARVRPPF